MEEKKARDELLAVCDKLNKLEKKIALGVNVAFGGVVGAILPLPVFFLWIILVSANALFYAYEQVREREKYPAAHDKYMKIARAPAPAPRRSARNKSPVHSGVR